MCLRRPDDDRTHRAGIISTAIIPIGKPTPNRETFTTRTRAIPSAKEGAPRRLATVSSQTRL
jgi:hypothetical protein